MPNPPSLDRRQFLTTSTAALGLLGLAGSGPAQPAPAPTRTPGAEATAVPATAVTAAMRRTHPERLRYRNPGAVSDLGVGLWGWPMPMDYNQDGRMDLIVTSSGTPYNGVYFFENTGEIDTQTHLPLFKAGVRLGRAVDCPRVSEVAGRPVVLTPNAVYPDFFHSAFDRPQPLPAPTPQEINPTGGPGKSGHWAGAIRSSQWHYLDYFGRGVHDLVVGIDDWSDYNWDGAFRGTDPSAFDAQGRWKYGPLRGYVYLLRNTGTDAAPAYGPPEKIRAGDVPLEVYGRPCPCLATSGTPASSTSSAASFSTGSPSSRTSAPAPPRGTPRAGACSSRARTWRWTCA